MISKKKPAVAFLLSFFLPGAGLCYLGKWRSGLLSLAVVLVIGILCGTFLSSPNIGISLMCGFASGAWAYLVADEATRQQTVAGGRNDISPDSIRETQPALKPLGGTEKRKELVVGIAIIVAFILLTLIVVWKEWQRPQSKNDRDWYQRIFTKAFNTPKIQPGADGGFKPPPTPPVKPAAAHVKQLRFPIEQYSNGQVRVLIQASEGWPLTDGKMMATNVIVEYYSETGTLTNTVKTNSMVLPPSP
ncbi:MAG: hypothetical protein C0404_03535 [Verrucomicrobia bacterium]|nr:hypothetical protein [Verrucomicrobiota bacterium]